MAVASAAAAVLVVLLTSYTFEMDFTANGLMIEIVLDQIQD